MKLENSNYIRRLFNKYLNDQCSEEERQMLLKYFESKANEEELKKFILSELESPDSDADVDSVSQATLDSLFRKIMKKKSRR